MRRCLSCLMALCFAWSVPSHASACGMGWWESLERALEVAPEDGRWVVIVFTGNDWSLGSMRLDQRVFEDGEFSYRFGTDFIPVNIDFPQLLPLSDEALAYSSALAEKYQVTDLPTFVAIRYDGSEAARFVYRGENSATMLALLRTWHTQWAGERRRYDAAAALRRAAGITVR